MTNVAYNTNIPFASNSPSQDQPRMQENTNSLKDLIEIDHVGFGDNQGGYHKVIHQPSRVGNPAGIAGVGQTFTKVDTFLNEVELFYESDNGARVGQISNPSAYIIRSAVNFTVGIGPIFAITLQNAFNVTSVVRNSIGDYTINFASNLPNSVYFPLGNSDLAIVTFFNYAVGSIRVALNQTVSGSLVDPGLVSIVIFG